MTFFVSKNEYSTLHYMILHPRRCAKSQRRAHPRIYCVLEFIELPAREHIVMWPLKPDEGRILKDFLLNQSTATAKHVALAFVENAMTVEGADCLYQIEALVKIASETFSCPPSKAYRAASRDTTPCYLCHRRVSTDLTI